MVVWGRDAENVHKYCKKGKQLYIEGRLQTRKWQDKEGKDRYSTEVVSDVLRFLGGAQSSGSDDGGGYGGGGGRGGNYSGRGATGGSAGAPSGGGGAPSGGGDPGDSPPFGGDEDIPF